MILYHFTSSWNLDSIKEHGIIKGDVPITIFGGYNAPWFTSDPSPKSQSWTAGGDKSGIRLTVEIPDGDSNLKKWTDVTKEYLETLEIDRMKNFAQEWFNALNKTGGGGQDHWYIYHGRVPPEWIKKVDSLS